MSKFSVEILKKYNISPKLQPTAVKFGVQFGGKVIDLRDDAHLVKVNSFVAMYPAQKYFTLKGGVSQRVVNADAPKVPTPIPDEPPSKPKKASAVSDTSNKR